MNYKEISRSEIISPAWMTDDGIEVPETKTIFTLVEFDFLDYAIEIPHFNPQSEDDIVAGINNRYISEQRKINVG